MIFKKVGDMINDIDLNIRIECAKNLKNFQRIKDISVLFSKKNEDDLKPQLGTFIHGIEDECQDVRFNIIDSMCKLTKTNEVAGTVFDFLLDLLNDEMDKVKEKSSDGMLSMVKAFSIDIKLEMIESIFYNFDEKNIKVKNNLYELIVNLSYKEEQLMDFTYKKLVDLLRKNIDKEKIFNCIKKLVGRNPDYFYKNISFDLILHKEPTLNDNIHHCKVIILSELVGLGYEIFVPQYMRKHMFYFKVKNALVYNKNGESNDETVKKYKKENNIDMLKTFMIEFLEKLTIVSNYKNLFEKYGSIFDIRFIKNDNDLFYVELFSALNNFYLLNDIREFEKLKIKFDFEIEIADVLNLCKEREMFIVNQCSIACPNKIFKTFNLPLKLDLNIFYKKLHDNMFIRVKSCDAEYYEIKPKQSIYLYNYSEKIMVSIIKKYNDSDIEITDEIEVNIKR